MFVEPIADQKSIDVLRQDAIRKQWKQWQTRFRKIFWDQLQKRAANLPSKKQAVSIPRSTRSQNAFQRQNRQSQAMTILRTIAPQFHNSIDPKIQRRLWQDVMEAANTNGNDIDQIENERIQRNGQQQHSSNDNWITLMKSEDPTRNVNNYHYAYNVQWPPTAQLPSEPQV